MKTWSLLSIAAAGLLADMSQINADWPQWRGPEGHGHANASTPPSHWSETKNVTWKTTTPGRGWSSPVIAGNEIWMTTAFETPATPEEAKQRLKANTGSQPVNVLSLVRMHAIGVDKRTGQILRNVEVLRKKDPQWVHKLNSYASPSPILENGMLYCHGGSYGTACLDTRTGKVLWCNQDMWVNHENGPGGTPILWRDLLIFHMDGSDEQFIVALDKQTGQARWKTHRSGKMNDDPQLNKAYGTPAIVDVKGQKVLFSPAADWLYGYDPATGRELWKLNYGVLGFSIVPRPITGHGMFYMGTSYMRPQLLAVRYEKTDKPKIAWRIKRSVPAISSPILVGDEIYFVSDSAGLVTCLDARTGREHWRERIGGNFTASPLHANGMLYFHSREGVTTVLQTGKSFKILAKNSLEGAHMASAAVDGDALLLRTDKALYRIEENSNSK